jgi:hypothetical protein
MMGKSSVFAGGTVFSQGRRYSNFKVRDPTLVARNVHNSTPPEPGKVPLAWYVGLPGFAKTGVPLSASDQPYPVDGLLASFNTNS